MDGHEAGGPGAGEPFAVVVGLDTLVGLQSARLLAARGVAVIGLARDPTHWACRTNACVNVVQAEHSGAALVTRLVELGPSLSRTAVLVPCTDLAVRTVGRHRDALKEWFHVPLAPDDMLELFLDKAGLANHAAAVGLAVPRTVVVTGLAEAERAATDLQFPCVVKPPVKTEAWEREVRRKVVRVADADAWLAFFGSSRRFADDLVVQEWVPGDDTRLYTCTAYFSGGRWPLRAFVSRKLRQWPPGTGSSCLAVSVRHEEVQRRGVALFEEAGYTGLAYVEMKLDERTDRWVVIETNVGRPTGPSAFAAACGTDLLYTMYCDAAGLDAPALPPQPRHGVKWIYLRRDVQAAVHALRRRELSPRGWVRSLRGPRAFAVWSLRDPRPFFADAGAAAGRKVLRRRGRPGTSLGLRVDG